jgi:hypothetical protein
VGGKREVEGSDLLKMRYPRWRRVRMVSTWRSPRRRVTLTPSTKKWSDSSMSLVKGMETLKRDATGGRLGML